MSFRSNMFEEEDLEFISKDNQSPEITEMLDMMDLITESENSLQSEVNFR